MSILDSRIGFCAEMIRERDHLSQILDFSFWWVYVHNDQT